MIVNMIGERYRLHHAIFTYCRVSCG